MAPQQKQSQPISEAHRLLGEELQRIRNHAKKTMREVEGFSSGHISNVEHGLVMPSVELIACYVHMGGDRARLVALYEAAERESSRLRSEKRIGGRSKVKQVSTLDSGHRGSLMTIEGVDSAYYVNDIGVIEDIRVVLSLRATVPGPQTFRTRHSYNVDSRRGVLSIEAGVGCQVVEVQESPSGAIDVRMALNRDVDPSEPEPYVLSYRIAVASIRPAEPRVVFEFQGTVVRHIVRVQFADPQYVDSVRWFASRSNTEARIDADPAKVFPVDPLGYYVKEFVNLIQGWTYGLAWNSKSA